MNRWRARLAELQRDACTSSTLVQNVQNVQKSPSVPTFEHFEQFEQLSKPAAKNDARTEVDEERAALVEYDSGAPRRWAEGFARLDPALPPGDLPTTRWVQFIDDCGRFLDNGWAARAEALGWGPLDLFGCDRLKPFARVNRAGLLWLLDGQKLLALAANVAAIARPSGGNVKYRRCPNEPGSVLAWELSREADNEPNTPY